MNAFTISSDTQNSIQERKKVKNNPLNDSIASEIPREERHTVQSNKKRKVVVKRNFLLNGKSKNGLSRNHKVTVKGFPGGNIKRNGKFICR